MTTSLPSARESTASHSSAQETMGTNSTPAGAGRETGPETVSYTHLAASVFMALKRMVWLGRGRSAMMATASSSP